VPAPRRATHVAKPKARGLLQWDIVLQGRDETVFFDF
jgi:protocatechuate 3,4-dioxygenase alpha subunit